MSRKIIILLCVITAILIFFNLRSCESNAKKINQTMDEICRLNEMNQEELPAQTAIRASRICEYFSPEVTISLESVQISVSSRDELKQLIFLTRTRLNSIRIKSDNRRLTVDKDKQSATMFINIDLKLGSGGGHDSFNESFNIQWIKIENDWRIRKISHHETIQMIE